MDWLSTGEPITLNFTGRGLTELEKTPEIQNDKQVKLKSLNSSLDGGSPRVENNLVEGDSGGGEQARSRSPIAERTPILTGDNKTYAGAAVASEVQP